MALNNLGAVAILEGAYDDAKTSIGRAMALFREIGSRLGQAQAMFNLGEAAFRLQEHGLARAYWHEALSINVEASALNGIARCHAHLGQLAATTREWAEARQHTTDALNLCAEHGLQCTSETLVFAANVLIGLKRLSLAGALLARVLAQPSLARDERTHAEQTLPLTAMSLDDARVTHEYGALRNAPMLQVLATTIQALATV
jgi:tetratricopeptide (TPR) repeat protein